MNAQKETILSFAARQHLAEQLGLEPADLDYIGMMELIPGKLLALFNIVAENHPQRFSTLSVEVG